MMRIRGMKHTGVKLIFLLPLLMGKPALSQVTTSQYDNTRTAATLSEKVLTPQNVTPEHFGKLGAFKVDGAVFAQPLYIPNVEIPGQGAHNVLYVATEHDSVAPSTPIIPAAYPYGKSAFSTKRAARFLCQKTWCNAHLFGRKSASPLRQSLTSRPERSTCWPALQSATRSVTTNIFSIFMRWQLPRVSKNSAARNSSRHRCQAAAQADPAARSISILSTKIRAPRSPSPTTMSI